MEPSPPLSVTEPQILRPRRRWRRVVLEFAAVFALASVAAAGVKVIAFRSFVVPSQSMSPTLMVDDRIGVELVSRLFRPYGRGEVVVFRDPGGWLQQPAGVTAPPNVVQLLGFAPESQGYLVKRIVGLGGDVVTGHADGTVSVNGEPFEVGVALRVEQVPFELTVPDGELFVLGDNRGHSSDSRANGTVANGEVVGRVAFIFLPVERFGSLD